MTATFATDLPGTAIADRRARLVNDAVISAYVRELAPPAPARPASRSSTVEPGGSRHAARYSPAWGSQSRRSHSRECSARCRMRST